MAKIMYVSIGQAFIVFVTLILYLVAGIFLGKVFKPASTQDAAKSADISIGMLLCGYLLSELNGLANMVM
ncbi:hypothetical protein HDU98_004072 [Podochytrium sp. JEL0797]|nr:hypothetical protein HDU98_004072 [Podochytrium sp. JEL0797]